MAEKIKLEEFFEFGVNEPINRLAYSKEDVDFKVKVIKKMQELGMRVKIDKAGNICATLEGNKKSDKSVVIGSHTDSVKDGGQYDGPAGVIAGLKTVEEIVDKVENNEVELDCDLKLVIWACEESTRFGKACLGSKWVEGTLDEESFSMKEKLDKPEEEKLTLKGAVAEYISNIQKSGIENIEYVDKVLLQEEILKAYEMHIEQYQYLSENNIDIGVVNSITGPYRMAIKIDGNDKVIDAAKLIVKLNEKAKEAEKEDNDKNKYRATVPIIDISEEKTKEADFFMDIELKGQSAHSGSTPMNRRQDAVLAAAKVVTKLNEAIKREDYDFKVYFNDMHTKNQNMNTVSGDTKITLGIDAKGLSEDLITGVLEGLIEEITLKEGVKSTCKKIDKFEMLKRQAHKTRKNYYYKETDKVSIENQETLNTVKIDVRMQVPTKSENMLNEIYEMVKEIAEETANSYSCRKTDKAEPVQTSGGMIEQVLNVCDDNNLTSTVMPSWAGHDVAHIDIMEKILLFIQSTGGSHNKNENTIKENIEKGIIVLSGSVTEDLIEVHEVTKQVENLENNPIQDVINSMNAESEKEALKEILSGIQEASKMGIGVSKDVQAEVKNEIIKGRKTDLEK